MTYCRFMDLGEKKGDEGRRLQRDRRSHESLLKVTMAASATQARQHPLPGWKSTMMAARRFLLLMEIMLTESTWMGGQKVLWLPPWREQGKIILNNIWFVNMYKKAGQSSIVQRRKDKIKSNRAKRTNTRSLYSTYLQGEATLTVLSLKW